MGVCGQVGIRADADMRLCQHMSPPSRQLAIANTEQQTPNAYLLNNAFSALRGGLRAVMAPSNVLPVFAQRAGALCEPLRCDRRGAACLPRVYLRNNGACGSSQICVDFGANAKTTYAASGRWPPTAVLDGRRYTVSWTAGSCLGYKDCYPGALAYLAGGTSWRLALVGLRPARK